MVFYGDAKVLYPAQCGMMVAGSGGVWYHQCARPWRVKRSGRVYCAQHDPNAKTAHRAKGGT